VRILKLLSVPSVSRGRVYTNRPPDEPVALDFVLPNTESYSGLNVGTQAQTIARHVSTTDHIALNELFPATNLSYQVTDLAETRGRRELTATIGEGNSANIVRADDTNYNCTIGVQRKQRFILWITTQLTQCPKQRCLLTGPSYGN
jgi:hypothetical protein